MVVNVKKTVLGLSGAAALLLLSSGEAWAGGPPVTTTLTSSKSSIYQNETLTLNATMTGSGNYTDCGTANPQQSTQYATEGGTLLCSKAFTSEQLGPSDYRYTAEACTVRGADLPVGVTTVVAQLNSGYCSNAGGQTANRVNITVLAGNAPVSVPTVGEWTMWGLAGLLLIGGGMFASRRFKATQA